MQAGDSLEILGDPESGATYLQAQGRVARMPREGDVEINTYKYSDYLPEIERWMNLDNEIKLLRAASPGMFVGE